MKRIILLSLLFIVTLLVACSSTTNLSDNSSNTTEVGVGNLALADACTQAGGNYLENSQECEGVSQQVCSALGGTFNECASACRNQPENRVCTLQCVVVCDFSGKSSAQGKVSIIIDDSAVLESDNLVVGDSSTGVVVPATGIESHVCTADESVATICTMDYQPVCGNDGETYSNGCTACSSGIISSWTAGAC